MALMNKKSPAKAQGLDWRENPSYLAAKQAHHDHKAKLPKLADAVQPGMALHQAVEEARKRRVRGEMELLAGKLSEADVALLRNAEIEAQRQLAIAEIRLEDAEADEQKLAAKHDAARKAAKQAAADDLRLRYRQALVDVKAAMEAAFAADAVLHGVLAAIDAQFPGGARNYVNQPADEDGFRRHLDLRRAFPNQARTRLLVKAIDDELAKLER